jgi:hypothetical protein
MDSAGTNLGTKPQAGATPGALDGIASAWETYYREASRRRHARGGGRHLREEKRRRRTRERLGIGVSALLVAGMTAIFYFVLSR